MLPSQVDVIQKTMGSEQVITGTTQLSVLCNYILKASQHKGAIDRTFWLILLYKLGIQL